MLLFFPATLLGAKFVEGEKVSKEVTEIKEGLAAFGKPVTKFTGHASIELTGVEDWGVF
jgi:hypothetical protein